MFYGTDTHAEAAAAIFSVIATCRLHALDPFTYFDEVLRVLPYWPHERYLELAPQHGLATRARLDASELDTPLARIKVPTPHDQVPPTWSSPRAEHTRPVADNVVFTQRLRISWLRNAVPVELERLVMRALAKAPGLRPGIAETALALERLVGRSPSATLRMAG
ncbi:hypothetical protein BH11MYX1_BH11MYX1_37260 [soil metagenome]